MSLSSRIKNAWNVFVSGGDISRSYNRGEVSYYRPDRPRFTRGNERSIINSIYNRIAIDVASVTIEHVRLDDKQRVVEIIDSPLNKCFNLQANLDQTGRSFVQDVVMSMLDEGCIAMVPIDTDRNPEEGMEGSFEIYSMRVGKILQWYPEHVRVSVYNELTGRKQEITVPKRSVSIVENPMYSVMNEPNSTLQRLIRKLNILDAIDEESGSGKLDLIIQLPYVIKSDLRKQQAEERRHEVERQLSGSKYGVAYTDGTEKITQLNRGVENNMMKQIEYLTSMLYGQLGITQAVMEGTADEKTMLNYYNRTIEPIVSAIVDESKRKFITQTARSQGQSLVFYSNPFKFVPISQLADIGDKMKRNTIMTSNEIRQVVGLRPIDEPQADVLSNPNLYAEDQQGFDQHVKEETNQNAV